MNEQFLNHLINEKSPYLLQHAHNPVEWYPWSDEAFAKAHREDKPIFLSIGYSTCHWCHVMERESFEDINVASILNDHFVAIKVDREERPDIDSVYMEVCQAMTGSGGWPLSILMTPDAKPFYAGTYFPKNEFMHLLRTINERWQKVRNNLLESADYISREIRRWQEEEKHDLLDDEIIDTTYQDLSKRFDPKFGGFSTQPKFPTPHHLLFLLRFYASRHEENALMMVEKTLTQMYKGGIFDHIGYGFARYSVDHRWLVPHFEKMLYDNALLAMAYTECYLATDDPFYKDVAVKILTFIGNEMTSGEGAFYTAIDADSEGVEGKYYLWTIDELEKILNNDDAQFISEYYGMTKKGNFEEKDIPNLIHQQDLAFTKYDASRVERIRTILYEERSKRVRPRTDDKILTGQNSLMIASYAAIGRMLNEKAYVDKAEKAMDFILKHLTGDNGRLFARYREGETKYLGYLDDYAYTVWGLIELFLATAKEDYLEQAILLNHQMVDLFRDEHEGGFLQVGKDSDQLFMNPKNAYDGALPSGNSVAAMNLVRLSEITGNPDHEQEAKSLFNSFAARINETPTAYTHMMSAYLLAKETKTKIVVVTDQDAGQFTRKLNEGYHPFTTSIILDPNRPSEQFHDYFEPDQPFAMYICQDYKCLKPIDNQAEALAEIDKI